MAFLKIRIVERNSKDDETIANFPLKNHLNIRKYDSLRLIKDEFFAPTNFQSLNGINSTNGRENDQKSYEFIQNESEENRANCKKIKNFTSSLRIKDVQSWVAKNCLFLKVYAPNTTCQRIIGFVASCYALN